ncbi:unnamed protein product [Orchesella dallaii]|uniref:Uncharacterized protein n=1 Tax=Orchesella dallaii TaxID=48710 RepID=A0ABP1PT38_9HEXA
MIRNSSLPKKIPRILPQTNHLLNLLGPNCLTHIINYNGMDISAPNQPIVLSRYDVIKSSYLIWDPSMRKGKVHHRARLFHYEALSKILQNKSAILPWCTLQWPDMQCEDIPLVFNAMRMKPYTCESHFHLFPPTVYNNPTFYQWDYYNLRLEFIFPGNWKKFWFHTTRSVSLGVANSNDALSAFVVNRPWNEVMVAEGYPTPLSMNPWAYTLSTVEGHPTGFYTTTARELFFITSVPKVSRGISSLLAPVHSLELRSVYILCRNCVRCKTLVPIKLGQISDITMTMEANIEVINGNTDNILWKMYLGGGWNMVYLQTGTWPIENEHQALSATPSVGEMRWRVETILFKNILGNSTIHSDISGEFCRPEDKDKDCGCDDKYPAYPLLIVAPVGRSDHTLYRIHHNKLKFVSCGAPLETSLPFSQLIAIFDKWIWVSILMVNFLLVPFVLRLIRANGEKNRLIPDVNEIAALFIICIKPLLEQGNPIPTRWEKSLHTQLVMGLLMLATLVISNGYRNENITQITLPRQPIPYDRFELLVRDNFTVLTRAVTGGAFSKMKDAARQNERASLIEYENKMLERFVSNYVKRSHDISLAMKSELFIFAVLLEFSIITAATIGEESIKKNSRLREMMNHTQLLPNWLNHMMDNNLTSYYNILERCNKTAIFLPDMEAHELYYEMRRQKHKYAYLSHKDDQLLDFKYGIGIGRWVNKKVLQRFYGMHTSGIWEWWNSFIVNFMTRVKSGDRTENEFTASNLKGNISIVFVTLVAGLVASVLGFLVEFKGGIWRLIVRSLRNFIQAYIQCKKYLCVDLKQRLRVKLCYKSNTSDDRHDVND